MLEEVKKLIAKRHELIEIASKELFKKFKNDVIIDYQNQRCSLFGVPEIVFRQKSTNSVLAKIELKYSDYQNSFKLTYYEGALMEDSLIGKYALIAYDNDICLGNVKKIVEDDSDTIKVESGTLFYKTAILKVFDKPEDAEFILDKRKKYLEMKANHRKMENEFRDAILGAIKYF